MHKMN